MQRLLDKLMVPLGLQCTAVGSKEAIGTLLQRMGLFAYFQDQSDRATFCFPPRANLSPFWRIHLACAQQSEMPFLVGQNQRA